MHSFFAFHKEGGIQNGFLRCLHWAKTEVSNGVPVVKIATARPADRDTRIVAEVTHSGVRLIEGGRLIPLKRVQAKCLQDE
jgi:hypothetical protein